MRSHPVHKFMLFITLLVMMSALLAACKPAAQATQEAGPGDEQAEVAKPSNGGGPGEAVNLKGDPAAGATIYQNTCQACHGPEGKGGVANSGSDDKEVPALNPIDDTMKSSDAKTFATNIDLFIEHGSTPAGSGPEKRMIAFGDTKALTPQQIADVIAYVMSLNK